MNGRSSQALFGDLLWPDADLEDIRIDYSTIRIRVQETRGHQWTVCCHGYIGYRLVGFWDEAIVERAELLEEAEFLDQCLESLEARLGKLQPDTGCPERNEQSWQVLRIHLLDGAVFEVVATRFEVVEADPGPGDVS